MIGFNIPIYMDESINCIKKAAENRKICGDGEFTKKCSKLMEEKFNAQKILLTTIIRNGCNFVRYTTRR